MRKEVGSKAKRRRQGPEKGIAVGDFSVDCRRQLALWVLHKGNTRLGKDDEKQRGKKEKREKLDLFKEARSWLSRRDIKLRKTSSALKLFVLRIALLCNYFYPPLLSKRTIFLYF